MIAKKDKATALSGGRKLTAKQQRFINEYLIDLNTTQAAIRVEYSNNTAGQIGDENLTKPEIQAAISAVRQNHLTHRNHPGHGPAQVMGYCQRNPERPDAISPGVPPALSSVNQRGRISACLQGRAREGQER